MDNGGPAFPVSHPDHDFRGMSMRQYYAGEAMLGALQNPDLVKAVNEEFDDTDDLIEAVRVFSWKMADAMLKE